MAEKVPEYKIFAIKYATRDRAAPTISLEAILTTVPCRWIISRGPLLVRIGFS